MAYRSRHRKPPLQRSRRTPQEREKAIVAAAERLSERLAKSPGGGSIGEEWQNEVWDLYDIVPELRTAARITGRTMGQCRLVLARVNEKGEPAPIPEDEDHPAKALLAAFAGGLNGQSDLLDALGVALTVPGEVMMVGALDQVNRDLSDDLTRMQTYSTDQVRRSANRIVVRLDESMSADRAVEGADPDDDPDNPVTAIRIWRPHPRYGWNADSAARSALPVLREIAGYDDHIKATLLSRLAGAGMMGIPDGVTLPGLPEEDDDPEGGEDGPPADPFMTFMMHVMSLAIKDRNSAAALVPILFRGDREDIEAIQQFTFNTPFDDKVADLRDRAIGRFGTAVDMPGELLTGYGALQHWTGALVTEDWKNGYLAELMGFACGSLTTGWLYPALVQQGHGDLPSDVIVWYDDSSVRTRENTGPEAFMAYDRGEISGDTLRRALGYDEQDMPQGEERAFQIYLTLVLKAPNLAPLLLPALGVNFTPEQLSAAQSISEALGAAGDAGLAQGGGGPGLGTLPPEPGSAEEPASASLPSSLRGLDAMRKGMANGRRGV